VIIPNNLEWPSPDMASASWNARLHQLATTCLGQGKRAGASIGKVWTLRRNRTVQKILSCSTPHEFLDDETVFNELQSRYPQRPEYGYDSASCLKRGYERTKTLTGFIKSTKQRPRILEAACGDGMTGWCLSSLGYQVHLHDLEDWRDKRARKLPLTIGDLDQKLALPDGSFDLILSYNSFEHVTDPAASLHELLRLCRLGGLIFLEFGPLYASPWGLHAYRTLLMPYPQFLFSDAFIQRKLELLGINDLGKKRATLQPLNRWRLAEFGALWQRSGCEILICGSSPAFPQYTDLITRYPVAFRGFGLTYADVTIQSVRVLMRKVN
jgi:SAM-dependent methyltransferase